MAEKAEQGRSAGEDKDPNTGLGVRMAIGGAVALGALVSGFMLSRAGRRLVGDAFRGRRRSPLSDRVLEALWSDPALGRRHLEVEEVGEGVMILGGAVASEREQAIARQLAAGVKGVREVEDRLVLDPSLRRRKARETTG